MKSNLNEDRLDRFAMLKYNISDIQLLFQGDVRFLRQFT